MVVKNWSLICVERFTKNIFSSSFRGHWLRTRETDTTGPNVSRVVTSMSGVQSASTVGCGWGMGGQ
jgi:hypothetical protein